MSNKTLSIFGIPIRLDSTLCDQGEVFLESPDGTTTRVRLDGIEPLEDEDDPDMETEL